jgi:hypothetical protein
VRNIILFGSVGFWSMLAFSIGRASEATSSEYGYFVTGGGCNGKFEVHEASFMSSGEFQASITTDISGARVPLYIDNHCTEPAYFNCN